MWKQNSTGKLFANWLYNNKALPVGTECTDGDCDLDKFVDQLQSVIFQGNLTQTCFEEDIVDPASTGFPIWVIAVIVFGVLLVVVFLGVFFCRLFRKPEDKFEDEGSDEDIVISKEEGSEQHDEDDRLKSFENNLELAPPSPKINESMASSVRDTLDDHQESTLMEEAT